MPITENKIKDISTELKSLLINNDMEELINDLLNSENSNNYYGLSCTDKSKISYLKGDRIPEDLSLIWNVDYRKAKAYHTKIGKLLSDKIDNTVIQKISAILYARKESTNITLKLTNDIKYYYLENNYSEKYGNNGQLQSSCMRYTHLQDAIGFYESIAPDIVQLLIAVDSENKTIGRALVWYNVETDTGNNITYLDRIYSSNDNISQLFRNYAEANGYISREDNTSRLTVNVNIPTDIAMPYFDTFQYYNINEGLNSYTGDVCLESVEGSTIDEIFHPIKCYDCDCHINNDEGCYSETIDAYLCSDCSIYVDECDTYMPMRDVIIINDTAYSRESESIVYSEHEQDYILLDESVYSEYHSDYYSTDCSDIVYSEYMADYILLDESVYSEHENDYFITDAVNYCSITKDYYTIETSIYSKFHNTYILIDESVYIEHLDDTFMHSAECIYYDTETGTYKHKQYSMSLMVV